MREYPRAVHPARGRCRRRKRMQSGRRDATRGLMRGRLLVDGTGGGSPSTGWRWRFLRLGRRFELGATACPSRLVLPPHGLAVYQMMQLSPIQAACSSNPTDFLCNLRLGRQGGRPITKQKRGIIVSDIRHRETASVARFWLALSVFCGARRHSATATARQHNQR